MAKQELKSEKIILGGTFVENWMKSLLIKVIYISSRRLRDITATNNSYNNIKKRVGTNHNQPPIQLYLKRTNQKQRREKQAHPDRK